MVHLATASVVCVAVLHVVFFIMESLLWMSPRVMQIFGNTREAAAATKVVALNQGFYNLGAAALLIWLQATGNTAGVLGVLLFIVCMGIVGALSAKWEIILIQSLPAVAGFVLVYLYSSPA